MKNVLFILLVLSLGASCNKYDEAEQLADDIARIETFLSEQGISAERTESGVFYIIDEEGTGNEHPDINSTVDCNYFGFIFEDYEKDGTISGFDSGEGITFGLANVIKGWQEGIPKLKRNGVGRFYIPSPLAYGNQRQGQYIEKNEILVFDVRLNHFW